jgi:siroheme synthase (precorrin-2 oxidase/ferrochelatase)
VYGKERKKNRKVKKKICVYERMKESDRKKEEKERRGVARKI